MSRSEKNNDFERIRPIVSAVLPTGVKIKFANAGSGCITVSVGGNQLRVIWLDVGWPHNVKRLLAVLKHKPDLMVAYQLSPGARELLAREGIGWIDATGAAEIAIGNIIVSKSGRDVAAPKKPRKWTAAVLGVAEALLCNCTATVAAVEALTGLSSGSCSNALKFLSDIDLLMSDVSRGRDSARRIVDKEKLLYEYASAAATIKPRASLVVGATWQDFISALCEFGNKWDKNKIKWAATGMAAAAVLAPSITTVSSGSVYVDAGTLAELESIAVRAGLRPIEGGRITIMPFPTKAASRLATSVQGLRVVPWPRAFADCRIIGVRGEEAADQIREVCIGS